MKKIFGIVSVSVLMLCGNISCSNSNGWMTLPWTSSAPIDFGVKYKLEPGLYVVLVSQGDSFKIKLEGLENKIVELSNGYEFTSPLTNLKYQITAKEGEKPAIYIVGGDGKLTLFTPSDVDVNNTK